MKILFVHPNLVHSKAHFGAIKRLYNLIHFMALRGHIIYLACFVDKWEEKFLKYTDDLRRICKKIELAPYPKRNIFERFLHFMFSSDPNSVLHNYSSQMRDNINSIVEKGVDIIHIEFTYMGQYIKYFPKRNFVTVINADELNFFSAQIYLKNKPWSIYTYLKYIKLKKYELDICGRYDKIFTITKKEAKILSDSLDGREIDIYPNTVDVDYFTPIDSMEGQPTLVFLGNFLHTPNVDGILWFYRHIYPFIKKQIPNIKLLIVGACPPGKILWLKADKSIEVTGYVEDVRSYISKGTVFICPIRFGGGMRGKILEALSMEKPCVTTSVGAEGIDLSREEGLVVVDGPGDFAKEVIALLKDVQRRRHISERGRYSVRSKYAEDIVFSNLEKTYLELLQKKTNL